MFLQPALKDESYHIRPSPVKTTSNHNQFLSYSKMHQQMLQQGQSSQQQRKVDSRGQTPLHLQNIKQISSERSGSDYVKKTPMPESMKRVNSTTKLTMKTNDFNSLSDQIAKLTRRNAENTATTSIQQQFSYQQRNQQLNQFKKTQQQSKTTQLHTEPSAPPTMISLDRYDTPKAYSQLFNRPQSSQKLEPKKNDIRRKAQTPQQLHDPLLQTPTTKSYASNNNDRSKVLTPLTTRPTISQMAGQYYPNSTKNLGKTIQDSYKSLQSKQNFISGLANFHSIKSKVDQNKSRELKPNEKSNQEKQNDTSVQLNQLITQVQQGQTLPFKQTNGKLSLTPTLVNKYADPNKQSKKLFENMQQMNKAIYGKQEKQQITYQSQQIRYYMHKMNNYQKENCQIDQFTQIYRDHFIQSFHALQFCAGLPPVQPDVIQQKKVNFPRRQTLYNKTVVLDLDETLIHCNENTSIPSDVIIPIEFPNGDIIKAGVNVRPHCETFLKQLTTLCEVIVFTASHQCYANKVLSHIDPNGKLIHHSLFRDSCVTTEEGVHIKNLLIFDRDLKDLVLVDNAAYSFGFQLDNGIPIIPFYDNKNDTELLDLLDYLKMLLPVSDVREVNRKHFKMHVYGQAESLEDALDKVFY